MVQPKSPPLSIRPGSERLALVQAWATDYGLSQHAAILALIDLGLSAPLAALTVEAIPPGPTAWPSGTVLLPEHTEDPGPTAPLRMARMTMPNRAKPGSRLKVKK